MGEKDTETPAASQESSGPKSAAGGGHPFAISAMIIVIMMIVPRIFLRRPEPAAEIAKLSWTPYHSEAGRFEIELPGAPSISTQDVPVGDTTISVTSIEARPRRDISILVAYGDFPGEPAPDRVEAILEGVARGIRKSIKLRDRRDDVIPRFGVQCRRLRGSPTEGVAFEARMFLVGRRLYQILIATRRDLKDPFTERALNTFRLISPEPKPESTPKPTTESAPKAPAKPTDDPATKR